jgi:hypothetical protein
MEADVPAQFTPENWQYMDSAEQIRLCRRMTLTSMRLAETSPFNVSEALLRLAEDWSQLASEITRVSLVPPARNPEPVASV